MAELSPHQSPRKKMPPTYWLSLFAKGVLMGAADVVPGVSGGTIAFITGIYTRLIDALKTLHPFTLKLLFQQGINAFWRAIDGWFLVVLFTGVLLSIVSLAKVIHYLLDVYPIPVWAFFFGLVLASIMYLVRQINQWRIPQWMAIIIGTIVALGVSIVTPSQLPNTWWMMMFAGSIAVCAMILPGISGSFILLLMGMYTVVIRAISEFNMLLLTSFALGAIVGLVAFSHVLSYLLHRFYSSMMALLTGFLVGSLNILWPWKQVHESIINRHGELVPLVQSNISPTLFSIINDQPPFTLMALLCAFVGFLVVFSLDRLSNNHTQ